MITRLFYFYFFLQTSVASTLFIGNGGEVLKVGQDHYVRDLFESATHRSPYFGCTETEASSYLDSVDALNGLNVKTRLFARKLCDSDRIGNGLSHLLVSAIRLHTWTLVDEDLGLLPSDESVLDFKDIRRLQAANRSLFNIRLQRQIWNRLNDEHKIALIIHEVLYSLMKPVCVDNMCNHHQQSGRVTRELTGQLFSSGSYQSNEEKEKLKVLMNNVFNSNLPTPLATPALDIHRVSISNSDGHNAFRAEKKPNQTQHEFVNSVCERWVRIHQADPNLIFTFTQVLNQPAILRPVLYSSPYGTEGGVMIVGRSQVRSQQVKNITSLDSCYYLLLSHWSSGNN